MKFFKSKRLFVSFQVTFGAGRTAFGNTILACPAPRNMEEITVIQNGVLDYLAAQGQRPTSCTILYFHPVV